MNNKFTLNFFFLFTLLIQALSATIYIGIGQTELIPPIGTPSAGYSHRNGEGMRGIHDPLLATALFIQTDEKCIIFCSVDHLGFTYEMVQAVIHNIRLIPEFEQCELYIASSHTHSGGGAHLNIPIIGESLAGPYRASITQFYIQKTTEAVIEASKNLIPAKIGIGYGYAENLSKYRSSWPVDITPLSDIAIIKVTSLDDTPLAVLFNYAVHPTVLTENNRLFSADFVGYARNHIKSLIGSDVQPLFFNGAQGDIIPLIINENDRFDSCEYIGKSLAKTIEGIWRETETKDSLSIKTFKESYAFIPEPQWLGNIMGAYQTEMNAIVLNNSHAFITIPGEISTVYDSYLKNFGNQLGYAHVSIFGLTNDAHGYIILPDSWRHGTEESQLSFGGENYGEIVKERAERLLRTNQPKIPLLH